LRKEYLVQKAERVSYERYLLFSSRNDT